MKFKISFTDTSIAFSYKSDKELRKSHFLFSSINNPILSKLGANIVKIALKLKLPVKGIIRNTIFRHFCGGETIDQCDATINKLAEYNINTILDYAAEGDSEVTSYDDTVTEILNTVQKAASSEHIPFSVFKPSGIASKDLLEKIQLGKELSNHELQEFENIRHRFKKIGKVCADHGIRLYIDSEDSYYQDPIDEIAYELMEKYNTEKVVVYNTYQMYRNGMLS